MVGSIGNRRIASSQSTPRSGGNADSRGFELSVAPSKPAAGGGEKPAASHDLSSVCGRLGALRRQSGMTQIEVAHNMGTTQPALARLEKGEMKPNLRTLSRYASAIGQRMQVSFFGGSVPNSAPVEPTQKLNDLDDVPNALARLRKERGITQSQVASRMETTQPVIARLESGEIVPNLRTLERYSEAIGLRLSIDFERVTPLEGKSCS